MNMIEGIRIVMDDIHLSPEYKQGYLFACRVVELAKQNPNYDVIEFIDALKDQLSEGVINNVRAKNRS